MSLTLSSPGVSAFLSSALLTTELKLLRGRPNMTLSVPEGKYILVKSLRFF